MCQRGSQAEYDTLHSDSIRSSMHCHACVLQRMAPRRVPQAERSLAVFVQSLEGMRVVVRTCTETVSHACERLRMVAHMQAQMRARITAISNVILVQQAHMLPLCAKHLLCSVCSSCVDLRQCR